MKTPHVQFLSRQWQRGRPLAFSSTYKLTKRASASYQSQPVENVQMWLQHVWLMPTLLETTSMHSEAIIIPNGISFMFGIIQVYTVILYSPQVSHFSNWINHLRVKLLLTAAEVCTSINCWILAWHNTSIKNNKLQNPLISTISGIMRSVGILREQIFFTRQARQDKRWLFISNSSSNFT